MTLQLVGPVLFLISGLACCHAVPGLRRTPWAARLAYAYLLGIAYVSGVLYLLSHVVGIVLGTVTVLTVSAVPVLAAIVLHLRKRTSPTRKPRADVPAGRLDIVLLILCGVLLTWITTGLLAEAVTNPVHDYDGRMTWSAQARYVHAAGTVDAEVLRERRWFVTHPRYPLLLPVAQVAALEVASEPIGRRMPRNLYCLFLPALLLIVHDIVRRLARPLPAAVTLLVGCLLPFLAFEVQGGAVSAYSDLPLAAFFGGALGLALRREGPGTDLAAGALFAACVLTKQEGVVLALFGLGAVMFARRGRVSPAASIREVLALVLPVVTAVVLLLSWQSGIADRHDEQYLSQWRQTSPLAAAARLVAVAPRLASELLATEAWGILWPLWTLAMILGWRVFRRRTAWLLLGTGLAPALCGLAVYAVQPEASGLVEVTWNRLMVQATAPILILFGLGVGEILDIGDRPGLEEDGTVTESSQRASGAPPRLGRILAIGARLRASRRPTPVRCKDRVRRDAAPQTHRGEHD